MSFSKSLSVSVFVFAAVGVQYDPTFIMTHSSMIMSLHSNNWPIR